MSIDRMGSGRVFGFSLATGCEGARLLLSLASRRNAKQVKPEDR